MTHKHTKKFEVLTPWDMVEIVLEMESKDRTETLIDEISPWFKDRSAFFRLLEKGRKWIFSCFRFSSFSKELFGIKNYTQPAS